MLYFYTWSNPNLINITHHILAIRITVSPSYQLRSHPLYPEAEAGESNLPGPASPIQLPASSVTGGTEHSPSIPY